MLRPYRVICDFDFLCKNKYLANNLANAIIYLTKVRKQKFAHTNPIHVLWHHHPNVLFRQPTA